MALSNELKNNGRKTPELLAQIMKEANSLAIRAIVVNAEKTTFICEINTTLTAGGDRSYIVATADGHKKTFSDVDSIAVLVMTLFPQRVVGDLSITVVGANLLTPTPKNVTDIIADARKQLVKLNATKTKINVTLAKINSELLLAASWEHGTPDEQKKFAEMIGRKIAVLEYVTYIDSEIARITAALPPAV